MDATLEINRTRWTIKYLTRNANLAEAQQLLEVLREVVTGLERRISSENLAARKHKTVVVSVAEVKTSLTT
jgi:hypothetical protein